MKDTKVNWRKYPEERPNKEGFYLTYTIDLQFRLLIYMIGEFRHNGKRVKPPDYWANLPELPSYNEEQEQEVLFQYQEKIDIPECKLEKKEDKYVLKVVNQVKTIQLPGGYCPLCWSKFSE